MRDCLPSPRDFPLPAESEAEPRLSQESGFELLESPKAQSIAEGERGRLIADQSLRAPAESPQVQEKPCRTTWTMIFPKHYVVHLLHLCRLPLGKAWAIAC